MIPPVCVFAGRRLEVLLVPAATGAVLLMCLVSEVAARGPLFSPVFLEKQEPIASCPTLILSRLIQCHCRALALNEILNNQPAKERMSRGQYANCEFPQVIPRRTHSQEIRKGANMCQNCRPSASTADVM